MFEVSGSAELLWLAGLLRAGIMSHLPNGLRAGLAIIAIGGRRRCPPSCRRRDAGAGVRGVSCDHAAQFRSGEQIEALVRLLPVR